MNHKSKDQGEVVASWPSYKATYRSQYIKPPCLYPSQIPSYRFSLHEGELLRQVWKKVGSFSGICTVNTFLVIYHCRYKMDDNKVVNYPSKVLKVVLSSFSNPTFFYISQIATKTGHTRRAKNEWMQIITDWLVVTT